MSKDAPRAIGDPCPHCGKPVEKAGPALVCKPCFGMWAPKEIVDATDFMRGADAEDDDE